MANTQRPPSTGAGLAGPSANPSSGPSPMSRICWAHAAAEAHTTHQSPDGPFTNDRAPLKPASTAPHRDVLDPNRGPELMMISR